ncbi:methyltransferase domain-containing protein [Candidatus Woesearchaeota archaeon]|nr:methyltransferase domain-containing protein [Candidatus Woesearchaeota archaeon]
MMLFVLSQKNLPLAQAEVASFYTLHKTKENYAFVSSKKKIDLPLAFTKETHAILFSCSKKNLEKQIKKYAWNKKIKGSFCVRSDIQEIERKLGGMIWDTLKKPVVDLEHPDSLIHFFFLGNTVYAGLRLWKNDNAFLQRKAQLRPGFYPASLDPQLALGLVNLSSAKKNAVVVDPFCGTGGILLEAAFSGRKAVGFDISPWMLEKCKQNLHHYKITKKVVSIAAGDATTFRKKCAAIVTELPFGKNTRSQNLLSLYTRFLENAKKNTNTIVVGFPDFVDYKKICRKTGWNIIHDFRWYLHQTLSKHVVVLKRVKR